MKYAITLLWLCCFVFNRGYLLGGLTMEFPSQKQDIAASMLALGGPFVLPESAYYAMSGAPYMVKGKSCQQRWDAWGGMYQRNLGKDWFVTQDGNWDCRNEEFAGQGGNR